MSYAAVSDLQQRFGDSELIQLTDRATPPAGQIDPTVAQGALDAATSTIDGYVSAKYQLPLVNPSPLLLELCCDIARFRLYTDQAPEIVQKRYDSALTALRDISRGTLKIDAAGVEPAPRPSVIVTSGNERRTTRDSMRGM